VTHINHELDSRSTMLTNTRTLEPELLHKLDAYWRAANYLSVGQIYLYDNPLLKRPVALSDVKPLVVGRQSTGTSNEGQQT
jgi:xylulose-5-phosphate/fructose-6-phosphate phosphoketolase